MQRRFGAATQHSGPARLVLLDFKRPEQAPNLIVRAGVKIMTPFGVTLEMAERRPWETMNTSFGDLELTEIYGGFCYIACSRAPARASAAAAGRS